MQGHSTRIEINTSGQSSIPSPDGRCRSSVIQPLPASSPSLELSCPQLSLLQAQQTTQSIPNTILPSFWIHTMWLPFFNHFSVCLLKEPFFSFFFFFLPSTHRFTCHFLKKAFRSWGLHRLFIYFFWLVTIFIFHLPVLSSFMTDKKFMEEGNSQYMEVITYKNVMWRKGSYLLEGPLVLCSVSWCSPKPGESVWQSLHPGMSTPAKPPQAHPATGKSSFTLTSGRQQAVVSTTYRAANTMSCNCTV